MSAIEESVASGGIEEDPLAHMARSRARANTMADRIARVAGFQGEIRPGALVKLKSGGPAMTVAVFDVVDGLIYCHWIAGGRPFAARYSAEMLEPAVAGELAAAPGKRGPAAAVARGTGEVMDEASPGAAIISESAGESGEDSSPIAANISESAGESVE